MQLFLSTGSWDLFVYVFFLSLSLVRPRPFPVEISFLAPHAANKLWLLSRTDAAELGAPCPLASFVLRNSTSQAVVDIIWVSLGAWLAASPSVVGWLSARVVLRCDGRFGKRRVGGRLAAAGCWALLLLSSGVKVGRCKEENWPRRDAPENKERRRIGRPVVWNALRKQDKEEERGGGEEGEKA